MGFEKKSVLAGAVLATAVVIIASGVYLAGPYGGPLREAPAATTPNNTQGANESSAQRLRSSGDPLAAVSVQLSSSEFAQFKIEPATERDFAIQPETVGTIDFNQELSVQVFTPFQGKIITLFAKAGDDVQKETPLYTIDSPDLVQAEATLISATGALNLTTRVLQRAKQLYAVQGVAQRDLDQAISDQQAAEGAVKAARNALRIFGTTDVEMDHIVADRKIDSVLTVKSPISGRVTARNAAPGLFVQPGNTPAPYVVSNLSTMWMLASLPETDIPLLRLGQDVDVTVKAYPGRAFHAKVANIGASVDPNTHRVLVRSEVRDPRHDLRPGMFATFVIRTGNSTRSPAVPYSGVVREGDGTMTVWVTTDQKRMTKREVKVGLQQDGYWQILEGLKPGEQVATEGALFLNNALTAASR
jgi:cobalt-zinc-cadmium efflux system membrane fusion protein